MNVFIHSVLLVRILVATSLKVLERQQWRIAEHFFVRSLNIIGLEKSLKSPQTVLENPYSLL